VGAGHTDPSSPLWRPKCHKYAPRLRVLLEPEEYKSVRGLSMAGRDATADVPRSYVNYSNTASTLGNMFEQSAAKAPGMLRSTLLRNAPRLAGAGTGALISGPAGAVAGDAAGGAVQSAITRRAAKAAEEALASKIGMSLSPQAAMEAQKRAFQIFGAASGRGAGFAVTPSLITNR
jgi:hypothetical protein